MIYQREVEAALHGVVEHRHSATTVRVLESSSKGLSAQYNLENDPNTYVFSLEYKGDSLFKLNDQYIFSLNSHLSSLEFPTELFTAWLTVALFASKMESPKDHHNHLSPAHYTLYSYLYSHLYSPEAKDPRLISEATLKGYVIRAGNMRFYTQVSEDLLDLSFEVNPWGYIHLNLPFFRQLWTWDPIMELLTQGAKYSRELDAGRHRSRKRVELTSSKKVVI